jgi:type VI secretion system protein ImpK
VHLQDSSSMIGNILVQAAAPLFNRALALHAMETPPEIDSLREQLIAAVKNFKKITETKKIDSEIITESSYALCAFLDESIAMTPWGNQAWAKKSLLLMFHEDTLGGEKFFEQLQRRSQTPQIHILLLELMYFCLALGFKGRYRIVEGGADQLKAVKEQLWQLIQTQRGTPNREFSPHWQGVVKTQMDLKESVSIWTVMMLMSLLILLGLQLFFSIKLNALSDPIYEKFYQVKIPAFPVASKSAKSFLNFPSQGIAQILRPEIEKGQIRIEETAEYSEITILSENAFASGSAEIGATVRPLILRIGAALKNVTGNIVLIGHTDNQPLRSLQYPSNWNLAKARAQSVLDLLASQAGPASRYTIKSRADKDPLDINDTAASRARNRRVDIVILRPKTESPPL